MQICFSPLIVCFAVVKTIVMVLPRKIQDLELATLMSHDSQRFDLETRAKRTFMALGQKGVIRLMIISEREGNTTAKTLSELMFKYEDSDEGSVIGDDNGSDDNDIKMMRVMITTANENE